MISAKLALIIAIEVALLFAIISFVLLMRNRALKKLLTQLRTRLDELVANLKEAKSARSESAPKSEKPNIQSIILSQIEQTEAFHRTLNSNQDIILDIDREAALPNRTAALRHAILLAEKDSYEKTQSERTDWTLLGSKYEALLEHLEPPQVAEVNQPSDPNNAEIAALTEELMSSKKRINNLEKFKQLFFELENSLQDCKDEADKHYNDLKTHASGVADADAFEKTLAAYHQSYDSVSEIISKGLDDPTSDTKLSEDVSGEIRHLRSVAADQHKIISDLQKKLRQQNSAEEQETLLLEMEQELNKQIRFVKESETCIQLMEEELTNAQRENESLKAKLKKIPQLKREFTDIRDQNDTLRDQVFSLKTANRKLNQQVDSLSQQAARVAPTTQPSGNTQDVSKLKDELSQMKTQYADLEEKFLDLKMQQ